MLEAGRLTENTNAMDDQPALRDYSMGGAARLARYKTISEQSLLRFNSWHLSDLQRESNAVLNAGHTNSIPCDACGQHHRKHRPTPVNGMLLCSPCVTKLGKQPRTSKRAVPTFRSLMKPLRADQKAKVAILALLVMSGALLFLTFTFAFPFVLPHVIAGIHVISWSHAFATYVWVPAAAVPLWLWYFLGHVGFLLGAFNARAWQNFNGVPFVTISSMNNPAGLPPNGGATFGPNTPGTTNQGWDMGLAYIKVRGGGTLFATKGTWTLTNALDANNNLITIPLIGTSDATSPVEFRIIGEAMSTRQQEINGAQPSSGTVIYASTATSASSAPNLAAPAILGTPAGGGSTGQNNVQVSLYNLSFQGPANPTLTGINLNQAAWVNMDNVMADVAENWSNTAWTVPTNVAAVGFIQPTKGSPHTFIGEYQCTGYYLGWWAGEDGAAGQVTVTGCDTGFGLQQEDNMTTIKWIDIEWCNHYLGSSVYAMTTYAHVHGANQCVVIFSLLIAAPPSGFPLSLVDTMVVSSSGGAIPPFVVVNLFYGNPAISGNPGYAGFAAGFVGGPLISVYDDGTGTMNVRTAIYANGVQLGQSSFVPLTGAYPYNARPPMYLAPTLQGRLYINNADTSVSVAEAMGVAISPNGEYAYVTNDSAGTVQVIRVADNTSIATVTVGSLPRHLAFTPDGKYVYVPNYGTGGGGNTVSVIDTRSLAVVATVTTTASGPWACGVTPNGKTVYVVNATGDAVSVISVATNTVIATITGLSNPHSAAVSPDGAYVYVTNQGANTVSVISTSTNTITAAITVGSGPYYAAVTPDGHYLYVGNNLTDTVSVIDLTTNTVTTTLTVGAYPLGIDITPDGHYAYVVNEGGTTLSIIDITTNTVLATTITIATGGYGIAITPDGKSAYVASYSGNVVDIITLSTNNLNTQDLTAQTTTATALATLTSAGTLTFLPAYTGTVRVTVKVRGSNSTATDGWTVALLNGATILDQQTRTSATANAEQTVDFYYDLAVTNGTSVSLFLQFAAVTGGTASVKVTGFEVVPL